MSEHASVLYDAPGPRTRRRTLVLSIVLGLLAVAGGYYFVYRPLDARGQLSMERWGPLIDPADERTPLVWDRIATGFATTLTAAAFAIVGALLFGTLLAIVRMQQRSMSRHRFAALPRPIAYGIRATNAASRSVTRGFVEVARGLPVLITIFFVWRLLPGVDDALWPLIVGLTIYNGVVISEIIRSGMDGLPSGQREAAESLGLSTLQTVRLVQLPQAFRIMLPALISQLVVILKDTSLGFIIGYEETLAIGGQLIQNLSNPVQVYVVIAVIFILINYSLSKLAVFTERRLALRRR